MANILENDRVDLTIKADVTNAIKNIKKLNTQISKLSIKVMFIVYSVINIIMYSIIIFLLIKLLFKGV